MQGWIKLHRCLLDKPIWKQSTAEQKTVLITILMLANHKSNEWEFEGKKFKCEAGQFVTSLASLAEKSGKGISIQNVRSALSRFEKLGFLTNKSTKTGRLITVENWGLYQSETENQQSNQQRGNKEVTTNKKDKNERNLFIPPSLEAVREYCLQRGNSVDPEAYMAHYQSNGWMVGRNKMKDWKAAVRTWERTSNNEVQAEPRRKF